MKPKLIKTEADYQEALGRIEAIFDAKPNTPEGDELELLVTLVEYYEEKAYPIGLPSPVDAIRFRMQQGLKAKDLIPYMGSASKVSEVLSGKRALSLPMIRKLVSGLGIPAEVLLQELGTELPPEVLKCSSL
jgi:HTH-type transcriptional regulator / antitoxin HigA